MGHELHFVARLVDLAQPVLQFVGGVAQFASLLLVQPAQQPDVNQREANESSVIWPCP